MELNGNKVKTVCSIIQLSNTPIMTVALGKNRACFIMAFLQYNHTRPKSLLVMNSQKKAMLEFTHLYYYNIKSEWMRGGGCNVLTLLFLQNTMLMLI